MKQELLIAVIAASSALCGVIISQAISIVLSFFDKRHKKQILLRQKYEEMMFHFSDSFAWINELNSCKTRHQLFAQAQPLQARKALFLSLLDFPALVETANQYILAQNEYHGFVLYFFQENSSC